MMCDIIINVDNHMIVLYPETTTSDLQTMLNATEAIKAVGGVEVEKREGQTDNGTLWIIFRILFLTGKGIRHSDIPTIDVSTDANCSLHYNITAGFVQFLTTPTFQVGFPQDSPRLTRPLSVVNTTAEELQTEMETLLSHECSKTLPPNVSIILPNKLRHEKDCLL